ncbi:efflux RND transporter periplasmic adaptor subunit [Fuerstiella marisgermanici]|uniref:Macrolide transporter subunit n=1 Tax=Fuerstiella marisgermanici TaxID=1891926 RepID=A0A1P8WEB6_9PLAN|nr:efflux RND transporter periplasmic adaptor subunit [Fuerstiella marisgermanici]APZ92391.1 macrolide transporter subunit [Fuerstiella marisgermanici]
MNTAHIRFPYRSAIVLAVATFCAISFAPIRLAGGSDRAVPPRAVKSVHKTAAASSNTSTRDVAQMRFGKDSMMPSDNRQSFQSAGDVIQGFTEPYSDINMAASEMGTLADVFVREGQVVKAGELIAKLDDAVLRASLEVAAAGMSAEGELKSAATQLELKKVEQEKLAELFGRQHASQQELDRVRGEVDIATARLQSVCEDLEVRRLEHARIQTQLKQRQIRSTIDGVVVDVRKDKGEFVSPSDPVVAQIVQLDPLLVVFSVPIGNRDQIHSGQTVAMSIGERAAAVQGEVEFVSPTADASSGSFRVHVRLPNSERRWHGGEKTILLLDEAVPSPQPTEKLAKKTR